MGPESRFHSTGTLVGAGAGGRGCQAAGAHYPIEICASPQCCSASRLHDGRENNTQAVCPCVGFLN